MTYREAMQMIDDLGFIAIDDGADDIDSAAYQQDWDDAYDAYLHNQPGVDFDPDDWDDFTS